MLCLSCGAKPQSKTLEHAYSEEHLEIPQNESLVESALSKTKDSLRNKKEEVSTSNHQIEIVEQQTNLFADHSKWNALLNKYADDNGNVHYNAFLTDIDTLIEYLDYLAKNSPEKDWPKNEKLAYYINLYNAATVKLILDNYPVKSIKEIKNPWGKNFIKIGNSTISLGDIEHKILRKMNEPRIHFAINCASYSCPKLLNSAFITNQLETQLHAVTLGFINDTTRNEVSKEKMYLSTIFKWYKKDFTENGTLIDFIKPYSSFKITTDTDIDFLKYNWSLNEAK